MELSSRVSAERVNGLSIVEKMTRGTMQLAGVGVEAAGRMLVATAGVELTNLARAMREAKTVLVCITFLFASFKTVFRKIGF